MTPCSLSAQAGQYRPRRAAQGFRIEASHPGEARVCSHERSVATAQGRAALVYRTGRAVSHSLPEPSLDIGRFSLDLHPHVWQPAPGGPNGPQPGLVYGADFKVGYTPALARNPLGLIQLVFPQTKRFEQTNLYAWNVDKRAPDTGQSLLMARCLYGSDDGRVGDSTTGGRQRRLGADQCWLAAAPRETCKSIAPAVVPTATLTKFAQYAVDLVTGKIANAGMLWGYYVLPPGAAGQPYAMQVQPPQETRLRSNNEHLGALAGFLGVPAAEVRNHID